MAKWDFNEFKTCWAGQKELGLGCAKRKKQKTGPLSGETYTRPIASDKQVLRELRLAETKNNITSAGSPKVPSWLQPGPWHPGSPTVFQTQGVSGAMEALEKLLGPQGASGNLRGPWEPRGSSVGHWESRGPSVVLRSLEGPQRPSRELLGVSRSQWESRRSSGRYWESGGWGPWEAAEKPSCSWGPIWG